MPKSVPERIWANLLKSVPALVFEKSMFGAIPGGREAGPPVEAEVWIMRENDYVGEGGDKENKNKRIEYW